MSNECLIVKQTKKENECMHTKYCIFDLTSDRQMHKDLMWGCMTLGYTCLIALVVFCRIFLLMTSNGDWSTFDLDHEPLPPNA